MRSFPFTPPSPTSSSPPSPSPSLSFYFSITSLLPLLLHHVPVPSSPDPSSRSCSFSITSPLKPLGFPFALTLLPCLKIFSPYPLLLSSPHASILYSSSPPHKIHPTEPTIFAQSRFMLFCIAYLATAAARRAFSELPAAARRSRRARFCEPVAPPITRKSILCSLCRSKSSFLSITCAPRAPHRYFWRG